MESFVLGVGTGVLASFIGFALKGWTTSMIQGFRIRKLLATDMREHIRGLRNHYPSLEKMDEHLTAGAPSFLWDDSPSSPTPDYVINAIHHLSPLKTSQCWKFYDVLSRARGISNEYNRSVRAFVTDESRREAHRKIAVACLHDLQRNYREVISVGSELLLEIKKNHWFTGEIDASQCDADRRNFGALN